MNKQYWVLHSKEGAHSFTQQTNTPRSSSIPDVFASVTGTALSHTGHKVTMGKFTLSVNVSEVQGPVSHSLC